MLTETVYRAGLEALTETIQKLRLQNKVLLETIEEIRSESTPNSVNNAKDSVALSQGQFTLEQLDEIVKNEQNLRHVIRQLLDPRIQQELVIKQKDSAKGAGIHRSPEYEAARALDIEVRNLIKLNNAKTII